MFKVLATVAVVAALAAAWRLTNFNESLKTLLERIRGLGPWQGAAAYIALYILCCVLFIPGTIPTLAAAILFGSIWKGFLCVSIGSTLGATAAFLLGRYLARGWVARKVGGNSKFKAIDEAVAREGWKIVGLVRLSPVFPFNLLNYSFGLTKVSLRDFLVASWIGMMPGTLMYVYVGSVIGDLARLGEPRTRTGAEWALYIVGLVVTILVTLYVTRLARQALKTIDETRV